MDDVTELVQSSWLWGPLLIASAVALLWFAARLVLWLVVFVPLLLSLTFLSGVGAGIWLSAWLLFLAGVLVFGVAPVRQPLLSARVFRVFRQSAPSFSETQRQAMEAGETGWERQLFAGRPDWRQLRRSGESTPLDERERRFLDGPVEAFCTLIDDYRLSHDERELPATAWELLRRERFFGLTVPVDLGGLGFSPCAQSAILMKIATRSLSAAMIVAAPNSLAPARLILRHGTDEQRQHYLPLLAGGEEIPCFALTGPEVGSDAAAITDHGVVCRQEYGGQADVLGVRLRFDKRYIMLGPIATLIGLAFKLDDPDGLLNGEERRGITLALVPADSPGVRRGSRHDPLHMGFPFGPVRGEDVFVPMDQVIGGAAGVGRGWAMLVDCAIEDRAVSLPALFCGAAKMAVRLTGAFARVRYQFREPIARFEGVQEALATIAGNSFAMDATRMLMLSQIEDGCRSPIAAALVKYNLSERCRDVLARAMDVHAGAGICLGPRNLIGEISKFPQIGVTVQGANVQVRSDITFSQGVMRCHPCLRDEVRAVSQRGRAALVAFDKVFARHLRLLASHVLRSVLLGLTGARFALAPRGSRPNGRYYRQLYRLAVCFALTTDVIVLALHGELRQRQRLAGRMADVLSQLYFAGAVLRFHALSGGRETGDRALLDWAMTDAFCRAQDALEGVCRNLPGRWRGAVLRRLLFPLGRAWRPMSDKVEGRLAEMMTVPSTARDRLTSGIFQPQTSDEPYARLEAALGKVAMTAALEAKLRAGSEMALLGEGRFEDRIRAAVDARLLSAAEAEELLAAETARREALRVDEFWPDEGRGAADHD